MADLELTDNDDVTSDEHAVSVDYLPETEEYSHTEELRQRALTMFDQIVVPVKNAQGTTIGGYVIMECNICAGLALPKPKSLIIHMRQHLKAELRGDYA
jgi:hypothetical protein